MILINKYRFLWLAFLLVFSVWGSAYAQQMPVVYEGKIRNLGVATEQGTSFYWKIYIDRTLTKEATVTEAEFVSGHEGSLVAVTWKKRGVYYFSVTAFGSTGCTNRMVGMIKVIPIEIEAIIAGATFAGACEQVKLDASKSIGDIIKYEWSSIDKGGVITRLSGSFTEFNISPTFAGPLPADFKVRLQVTNRKGDTHSDTVKIRVDLLPVADIYSPGKLEKDGSMIVNGAVSTGVISNYRWFTSEGKIVGSADQPTAKLFGAGIYSLEITDIHGCKSTKSFKFPLEISQIIANPDYARISWAQDTTIKVLDNDHSTVALIPGSMHILEQPTLGETRVNTDGSITYMPQGKKAGRDQFIYEVCDAINLCASTTVTIDIYDSGIRAPEGFSPNGDGMNENFVIKGLENYPKSQLYVYTRSGQLIYQSKDYLNDWGGTTMQSTLTNLELVPTGTYYFVLKLGGTNRSVKDFVYVAY